MTAPTQFIDNKENSKTRLKNNKLISARKQLNWDQKNVAATLGISKDLYGLIERIQFYPNDNLQRKIIDFYQDHKINLNQKKIFPKELEKIKSTQNYIFQKNTSVSKFLPLYSLDQKLLMPVEIDDKKIRNEDFNITLNSVLKHFPEKHVDITKMFFGLNPYEKEYDPKEIGKKYGITSQRALQIKKRLIKGLKKKPVLDKLREFL